VGTVFSDAGVPPPAASSPAPTAIVSKAIAKADGLPGDDAALLVCDRFIYSLLFEEPQPFVLVNEVWYQRRGETPWGRSHQRLKKPGLVRVASTDQPTSRPVACRVFLQLPYKLYPDYAQPGMHSDIGGITETPGGRLLQVSGTRAKRTRHSRLLRKSF
jgi:hypothetical protein